MAYGKVEYTSNMQKAYKQAFSLHFSKAQNLIALEKIENPDNLYYIYIEDLMDALRTAIDQDIATLNKYEPMKNKRLDLIEEQVDPASPYYLLFQAEIRLHWSVGYASQEQFTKAANEIASANRLLKQNNKKFPAFIQNQKSLGVIHAIVGTIPEKYQWIASILGFSGSVDQGMKELKTFLDKTPQSEFYEEANLFYTYFLFYLKNDTKQAYARVQNGQLSYSSSPLNAMFAAMIASKGYHTDDVLKICRSVDLRDTYSFPYLDYLIGEGMLYRGDTDAVDYLLKFLKNYKGKHKVKSVYQKIAWYYLLQYNTSKYKEYMTTLKSRGASFMDSDKQAQKDAEKGTVPHIGLLQARLYCDGGYFAKAMSALASIDDSSLAIDDKIEYKYRSARIQQLMNFHDLALIGYDQVIKAAIGTNSYLAPKACLEKGLIYEKIKKNYPQASACYQKVLTYKNHEYKNSLDQQAKAGLSRLK